MKHGFEGKVGIITGASRGIGEAVALKMLENGSHVIGISRSGGGRLCKVAEELPGVYHEMTGCLSKSTVMKDAVRVAFKQYGKLDYLVSNAGVLRDSVLGMIQQDSIDETIDLNLVSVITAMQEASRLMKRSGGGSIVNVSSIIGRVGNAGQVVYGASKAGVIGATLSAAKELAPHSVRVNAVAPGYIDTSMIQGLPDDVHQQRIDSIAMGRVGTPEDVANVIAFLVSDMSSYVTGQVVGVDGGMLI